MPIIITSNMDSDDNESMPASQSSLPASQGSMPPSQSSMFDSQDIVFSQQGRELQSSTKRLRALTFEEKCQHYINYFRSPEGDRVYPPFCTTKVQKHSFRSRIRKMKYDSNRGKLFKQHIDEMKIGNFFLFLPYAQKL